jgi:hypothetical protein
MAETSTTTARELVAAAVTSDRPAFASAWQAWQTLVADADNPATDGYRDLCIALLAQIHGLVGAVAEHLGVTPAEFLAGVDAGRPPRTNGNHP